MRSRALYLMRVWVKQVPAIATIILLLLGGGVSYENEQNAVAMGRIAGIERVQGIEEQQLRDMDSLERDLEKKMSALIEEKNHLSHVHIPGSVCVCVKGDALLFQSLICEHGEFCDGVAINACEEQHRNFKCAPLSQ